jgi:seryl-tRNA synthetase
MLDIHLIREKPDFVRERLATRGGGDEKLIDEILRLDLTVRQGQTQLQKLYAERNRFR